MAKNLKQFWQSLSGSDRKVDKEVVQIATLQQAAAARRAEYAEEKSRTLLTEDHLLPITLLTSRQRMEEAESAHLAALQKWENQQMRLKSR